MKKHVPFLQTSILVLGIVLSGLLQSCGPSDEEVYIKIDEKALAWGSFKKGTYWIYQEESTGTIDSVYVYRQEERYYKSDRGSKKVRVTYEVDLFSIFIESLRKDTIYYDVTTVATNIVLGVFNDTIITRTPHCKIVPPPPPFRGGFSGKFTSRSGPRPQLTRFDSIYPTYRLGKLEFTNVIRANNNINYVYGGTPTLLYSASNVGMIRKEFPEFGEVWNLIRYNIVQ